MLAGPMGIRNTKKEKEKKITIIIIIIIIIIKTYLCRITISVIKNCSQHGSCVNGVGLRVKRRLDVL